MKKNILYLLIAGLAIIATACEKESILEGYEGSVNLSVEIPSTTRADEGKSESVVTPDGVKVRIYRRDGVTLIRRYTSLDEIPNPLYLVAGDYLVKAEGGDVNNTAFIKPVADTEAEAIDLLRKKLCYLGEKTLSVVAKQNSSCNIVCKTINSQINVNFDAKDELNDATGRVKYENRMLRNVKVTVAALDWKKIEDTNEDSKISIDEFKAAVTKQKAPKLEFKFTGDTYEAKAYNGIGYYIVPENASNTFVWAFEAVHIGDDATGSPADGEVAQVGKMTNIKPGYGYTVDFCYSRTPDGFAGVNILVDDSVETIEQTIYFKPQPTISGEGIVDGINVYKQGGNGLSLKCESINPLTSIALGGVEFFGNSAVIDNAIEGITAEKKSPTLVEFTITDDYFKALKGASHMLAFKMKDEGGEDIFTQDISIKKRGLMLDEIQPNLWTNTAEFKAFVPEDNVGEVKIQFRKKGSSEWVTLLPVVNDNKEYAKTSSPAWIGLNKDKSVASNGQTPWFYQPDTNKSIFANSEYECQLLIDGDVVDSGVLKTSTTQVIPDGDFSNSSMACFGYSTNDNTFWDSGNNSTTKNLCTYDGTYNCVKLKANDPGLFDMMGAGNIFTGQFRMNGTTGTVSFGVNYEWSARPKSLKLKYLAHIGKVTHTTYGSELAEGEQDEASIYIAIIDWGTQHKVASGTSAPTGVWSPEDGPDAVSEGKIIGYGVYYPSSMMTDTSLVDLEIPIYYYDTEAKPNKDNYTLIIAASTSRYGDFMNGCATKELNEMWVDDFKWGY